MLLWELSITHPAGWQHHSVYRPDSDTLPSGYGHINAWLLPISALTSASLPVPLPVFPVLLTFPVLKLLPDSLPVPLPVPLLVFLVLLTFPVLKLLPDSLPVSLPVRQTALGSQLSSASLTGHPAGVLLAP